MVVFDLLVVGCGGRGDAAEVSVFEPVAVSFEAMTSAWWTSRSIMAADYVVAEDLTPANRGWDMFGLGDPCCCLPFSGLSRFRDL
jgi:hypothetical protein